MNPAPDKYAPASPTMVADLVRAYPLAWIVSPASDVAATPLPLRPVVDAEGRIEALLGHFARSNPQVDALRADPRARVLLLGPSGYISPSWMADRTQAPTWNYASVEFRVEVAFTEDEADLRAVLDDLIAAMEAGRPGAWAAGDMGARYGLLASRIIAFRARVLEVRAVLKLGQDERDDVYADILAGLGDGDLVDWMMRLNRGRAGT
jgi:predicted FMN-binding regulatory protein PaiB